MKLSSRFLRKLLFVSPIAAIALLFQNFDAVQLAKELPKSAGEKKIHMTATSLSKAAEEIFLKGYAPEAPVFAEKMNERLRVTFEQKGHSFELSDRYGERPTVEPEVNLQIIGNHGDRLSPQIQLVNDRVRMELGESFSCEYSPVSRIFRLRAPIKDRSSVQIEHLDKSREGRLSWQLSW